MTKFYIFQTFIKIEQKHFLIYNYITKFRFYVSERPNNAVAIWKPQPIIELVRSLRNSQPKSSVVITEITDDEEVQDEVNMENDA